MWSSKSIRSATFISRHVIKQTIVIPCRLLSAASEASRSIGFIGLGNMGGHMAHNLLKAGQKVTIFDLNKTAVARAESQGAKAATTPREVAEQVDIIITMLPSSPHVKTVYTGDTGVLKGVRKGSLLIDSSTIDPATARTVSQTAHDMGLSLTMVDAPVSGGVGGAEGGTLTFMVGGSDAAFGKAKPVLQMMGKNIVHCGANGTGQVAKLANNLVLAISMCAVSEGMNLGVQLGMDPKILAGIFNTSSARCWSSDTYNPCPGVMPNVPASRNYTGGFAVDLMKKDLGLAIEAAKSCDAPSHFSDLANTIYSNISTQGHGGLDFSSVYKFLNERKVKCYIYKY